MMGCVCKQIDNLPFAPVKPGERRTAKRSMKRFERRQAKRLLDAAPLRRQFAGWISLEGVIVGFHSCPIEPSDWTDGPCDLEGDCPKCEGTGTVCGDNDLSDEEKTCDKCGGSGFLEPFDGDYEWDE